ncbi:MAG TPA: LuxR C-terminal-related transcriptional regulator [Acidobacteriota bacterium]|nr:LuxR C-terminal-related transcriptional regulator [Acidobacteriota bacterium]
MRQSEYLDILCNTADGVFIVDANQRIVRWNKGAERILKYSESEVLNHDCYRVMAGRVRSDKLWCHSNCKVQSCLAKGSPVENFDLLTRTNEGEPVWLNISILSPSNGDERYTAHLLRDVTRERTAGEAIEQFLVALGLKGSATGRRPLIPAKSSPAGIPPTLSTREVEVLKLLAEGLSTKVLAQRLNISHFTARNHIQNILVKLDLHSKAQAVSYAFKQGII